MLVTVETKRQSDVKFSVGEAGDQIGETAADPSLPQESEDLMIESDPHHNFCWIRPFLTGAQCQIYVKSSGGAGGGNDLEATGLDECFDDLS
ncbi:hypothetical protein [Cyanobium sp. ATX 6F1]|uniref:hypothetical protein n=1 Tax=unclassified Cyanobium TaxID=2627006 RepID=UPI0020CCA68F|nr:hypothetical protein [Cyanobium sp. ATX 6F1]